MASRTADGAEEHSHRSLLRHVEPLDPWAVPAELRGTPGFVARLLDPDIFLSSSTRRSGPRLQNGSKSKPTRSRARPRGKRTLLPATPMDTLATTALTSLHTNGASLELHSSIVDNGNPHHISHSHELQDAYTSSADNTRAGEPKPNGHQDERPTKRARSEALPSPQQQQQYGSRPATSHNVMDGNGSSVTHVASIGHRVRQPSQDELDIGSFLQELADRRRNDYSPQQLYNKGLQHVEAKLKSSRPGGYTHTGSVDIDLPQYAAANPYAHQQKDGYDLPSDPSAKDAGPPLLPMRASDDAVLAPQQPLQTQTPPENDNPAPEPVYDDEVPPKTMGPPVYGIIKSVTQKRSKEKSVKAAYRRGVLSAAATANRPKHDLESSGDDLSPASNIAQQQSPSWALNGHSPASSLHIRALADVPRPASAHDTAVVERPDGNSRCASLPPPEIVFAQEPPRTTSNLKVDTRTRRPRKMRQVTTCAACKHSSNSTTSEIQQWIQCNGCKEWFHFVCVGLKSERDIRSIDKFHCKDCEPQYGPTTYVRKSSRAHVSVDYAKLTEGVVQTGDDTTEHHFVRAIKAGEIELRTENFPRMRPEEVTAEYLGKSASLLQPIVIPGCWNPKPVSIGTTTTEGGTATATVGQATVADPHVKIEQASMEPSIRTSASRDIKDAQVISNLPTEFFPRRSSQDHDTSGMEVEEVRPLHTDAHVINASALLKETDTAWKTMHDLGQDRLGMIIPRGLTVQHVAELYGAHERLPVIEVKTQSVSEQPWTVGRWAAYYDDPSPDKIVRNVISLEVSHSPLGRLLRRPDAVRDLDLAGDVWPEEEEGPGPKVGFYVLMSVKDSYTDFHIDFGGSSVYYHIVKGKKTFFFIPPKPKYLKIYEEWNKNAAQNHIWLGNETKECYRVDLDAGDTMIIPAGWIHSVWTPDHSLVVGGNFLTRLHYQMQFRIVEIEKATSVALKYRFPYFQKVMWYTVIKYLEEDPLPASVESLFHQGRQFVREHPIYEEHHKFGHNSDPGLERYNARYYPRAEIEGLPDLVSYIFRTVMIQLGRVDGITPTKQNAVTQSIPASQLYPLETARIFAMWVAWKRGNEDIPQWAHPNGVLPDEPEGDNSKKLNVAALKKLEVPKAIESYVPVVMNVDMAGEARSESPSGWVGNHYASPKNSVLGPKRSACDACRRRRVACKHKTEVRDASMINGLRQFEFVGSNKASLHGQALAVNAPMTVYTEDHQLFPQHSQPLDVVEEPTAMVEIQPDPVSMATSPPLPASERSPPPSLLVQGQMTPSLPTVDLVTGPSHFVSSATGMAAVHGIHTPLPRETRNKACAQCRRSKRRCLHDESGQLDPSKLADATKRPLQAKKRTSNSHGETSAKKIKREAPEIMESPGHAQAPVAMMTGNGYPGYIGSNSIMPIAQAALLANYSAGAPGQAGIDLYRHNPASQWDIDPALMTQESDLVGTNSVSGPRIGGVSGRQDTPASTFNVAKSMPTGMSQVQDLSGQAVLDHYGSGGAKFNGTETNDDQDNGDVMRNDLIDPTLA